MNKKIFAVSLILALLLTSFTVFAGGTHEEGASAEVESDKVISEQELKDALGDPSQGEPDIDAAAEKLGITVAELEELMKTLEPQDSVEVDPYTLTINGIDFKVSCEVFTWDELPSDVVYQRQEIQTFADETGAEHSSAGHSSAEHSYEVIYVESGNLNWYQAAFLAADAGGYLACPTSEDENDFVFSLVDDEKYFWSFEEGGDHYGISIGPFLGGYQPEGSPEPDGGWNWLSGEAWEYTNWAQNLDDGVIDKDPRDNTQPNNSGESQPIMGFGEMNLPVPTWGDYMESVGTYGLKKSPGQSYGFIIEYE